LDVGNATSCHLNLKKASVTLILFDLDDTLLGNEMNNFIPAYLQSLAKRMAVVSDPALLIKTLLSATRQMIENLDPGQRLEAKFDAAFYPTLNLTRQDVQGIIDTFYVEDFPKLRGLTQLRPEAVRVVKQIINRGDQAAIATNPLFPLTAIQQRLNWAGLPVKDIPFVMVPSYETFHFAKPNPAYYAEYLAQLGWPKIPIVMVGNDVDSDIGAARQLGLPVFWMTKDGASNWNGSEAIPPHGEITDLIPWMDRSYLEPLHTNFTNPNSLLAVLRSTPAALDTLCHRQNVNLEWRPTQGEWSVGEILCHLRDVDLEVNYPRLEKAINERNPFLPGQDTDAWAIDRQYSKQDSLLALSEFTKARKEMLRLLVGLDTENWERRARHAIFGPTRLNELVNIISGHDILHIQQVYKILETQK
jgi:FMN phosphatase YigB (HAD superfamily)